MENSLSQINFERISRAIDFINSNFRQQPSLDEIANYVHLSPFHFQRLFTEWAGVSPKKFLQYLTLEHAKSILKMNGNMTDATDETGLSGTGRLHDLFLKIESMTPGEYKNGGENLKIKFNFYDSPFGKILIASTSKGICYLAFYKDQEDELKNLKSHFPKASFKKETANEHLKAVSFFQRDFSNGKKLNLHLKGTPFQIKVWEALLTIPERSLCNYGQLATRIGKAGASRTVGSAIGANPVAYLIPCHRVILSGGQFGNYMWGSSRKQAIIGWEQSLTK